jgi:peptidoglycan/xylan/chitin deacetylase (PgdA/CDA1 family)
MKHKFGLLFLLLVSIGIISVGLPQVKAHPLEAENNSTEQPSATFINTTPTNINLNTSTPEPLRITIATVAQASSLVVSSTIQPNSQKISTRTWLWNPPGKVVAPILLYHHVAETSRPVRYYVSPAVFEEQIRSLIAWGYTPIPLSRLVLALVNGGELPEKPVVITFDDGNLDVYQNAFPILRRYGFTATFFVIVDQIGITGYIHSDQLQDLLGAGWEIGSHTITHADLNQADVDLISEITQSRQELEALLGTEVTSFSFPYGLTNPYATKIVRDSGYRSAVGLGGLVTHALKTQFYLSRIEVRGDADPGEFVSLLPWSGPDATPEGLISGP